MTGIFLLITYHQYEQHKFCSHTSHHHHPSVFSYGGQTAGITPRHQKPAPIGRLISVYTVGENNSDSNIETD
jgi:hypothetical protein